MRVERSVEMRGRMRGRQTLAMPMLHSTTIQTPAGTRVPGFVSRESRLALSCRNAHMRHLFAGAQQAGGSERHRRCIHYGTISNRAIDVENRLTSSQA